MHGRLYCGDNLRVMESLPEPFVDLCYIDPPFFSQRHYEVLWGEAAEQRMFRDRWKGGLQVYLDWMEPRIRQIHRLLKPSGTFYLHCDWHAGHYLKVLCDEIFGYRCFRNEIVWCYKRWPAKQANFQKMHDTIFRYSKTDDVIWNQLYEDFTEQTKRRIKGGKQIEHYVGTSGKVLIRATEKDSPGVAMCDYWHIPMIAGQAKERLGYPTQKPEGLLARIVRASSNPGDFVFDPFCGCGTTVAVAQQLGRQWAGCDVSATALRVVKERLARVGGLGVKIIGMEATREELQAMEPFEFQNWAVSALFGIHSPTKAADRGIDGFTGWLQTPIQVKQQDHVGRPVVQQFRGSLGRKTKGVIVALGFAATAHEEAARLRREEGIDMVLLTTEEVNAPDFDSVGL